MTLQQAVVGREAVVVGVILHGEAVLRSLVCQVRGRGDRS